MQLRDRYCTVFCMSSQNVLFVLYRMVSQLEDYEVLNIIGTGSFGTCYKVRKKSDGNVYVWKAIDYGNMPEERKQV